MEVNMVKRLLLGMCVATIVAGAQTDIYTRRCVPCHQNLPTSLGEMFKNYLLMYSSEKFVKMGLKNYLKNPSRPLSVMSELFLDTYGIKRPTHLNDDDLDRAIDIYWEKFKVFDKLE